MLDYTKMILRKVSFNPKLFKKELYKAIKYLALPEIEDLERWVFENYGLKYTLVR